MKINFNLYTYIDENSFDYVLIPTVRIRGIYNKKFLWKNIYITFNWLFWDFCIDLNFKNNIRRKK